jgi:hypothetical protein
MATRNSTARATSPSRTARPGRRSKRRRSSNQLGLKLLYGRGGPGRGQGRKKTKHDYVVHTRRPFLDKRHPVHVSMRIVGGLPSLRGRKLWGPVRRGFVFGRRFARVLAAGQRPREVFRIVHFSVQGQHIHLLCEARDSQALSRGIQGFKIRVAKAINAALERSGRVFSDRYHARIITNPTQCRHALAYVLQNQRHHAYQERASYPRGRVDPHSSAMAFRGWTVATPQPWANAPPTDTDGEDTVAEPETWLLRGGWKRGGGAISPSAIVGVPAGAPPLPVW